MKSGVWTLAAGGGLLVPAYVGLLLSGVPTLLCPLPALTVIPAFVMSSLSAGRFTRAAVLVPTLLFFAWNPALFWGEARVPKRTWALLGIATVLSAVWFVGSWKYGLEYQGRRHTYLVCVVNSLCLMVLWTLLAVRWRRMSFAGNLLLHWLLFAWLGWYAFPYLGELP